MPRKKEHVEKWIQILPSKIFSITVPTDNANCFYTCGFQVKNMGPVFFSNPTKYMLLTTRGKHYAKKMTLL